MRSWHRWPARLFALLLVAAGLAVVTPQAASATVNTLCNGYSDCRSGGYTDGGYEANNGNSYWGAYSGHNCTNYVAYTLTKNGSPAHTGLGNAGSWGPNATSQGFAPDNNPALGAVAWWDYGVAGNTGGHVAIVEGFGAGYIIVSEDNSGGDFHWKKITGNDWPSGFIHFKDLNPTHYAPLAGDFNGDGYADIVLRDSADGSWHVKFGPSYSTDAGYTWASGANYQPFVGDFNHDGYQDLGLRDAVDGSLHVNYGPGFTTGAGYAWASGSNYRVFAGDFDGNGYSDIGIRDSADGSWHTLYAPGFATGSGFSWASGANYYPLAGDFNHDGYEDVSLYDQSSGTFHFEYGPGFTTAGAYAWGAYGNQYQPFAADFNHDGYADIGLRDSTNGMFYFKLGPNFASNQSSYQWVTG